MTVAIFAKIGQFLKKNWIIVVAVIGLLWFSGIFKNIANRIKINGIVSAYKETPEQIDYNYTAMQVHSAFDKALWFIDRDAITSIINSLNSQSEFMTLVRVYAVQYNEDLREHLRDRFNDKQYAKLKYR